ncbi:hypothetical protein [Natranaerobius trueperi]|uniref:hypothetical protein n=1 Tax=Natranaerobius trueperi TaxID=759412 RepID=UPI0013037C6E|nr:hypothetical protein [Natranaerobius trueperi]
MFEIIGIFMISIVIAIFEMPDLIQNKLWKELVTFIFLLTLGTGILIMHLL